MTDTIISISNRLVSKAELYDSAKTQVSFYIEVRWKAILLSPFFMPRWGRFRRHAEKAHVGGVLGNIESGPLHW